MQFKRDRYVWGKQNKYGKLACSDNFRPKENDLINFLLRDINAFYFSDVAHKEIEKLIGANISKRKQQASPLKKLEANLKNLKDKKQKALNKLLDDLIDQDAYDGLIFQINPSINELTLQIEQLQTESVATAASFDDLKQYALQHLNLNEPITELTPTVLARFIEVIKLKADDLEVHSHTSKSSAFILNSFYANSSHATASQCAVCGNISTGCTSCVL